MDNLHLPERYLAMLLEIIRKTIPDATVLAFGSRVSGDCHDGSDLDIVIRNATRQQFEMFKTACRESNIPILVDVLRWESVPEYFREDIEKEHVVIQ